MADSHDSSSTNASSGRSRLKLVGRGPEGSLTLRFSPTDAPPRPASSPPSAPPQIAPSQSRHRGTPPLPAGAASPSSLPGRPEPDARLEPTDPRWVLAIRTEQMLQGALLQPAARKELLRVGGLLGLNPFDANLVIAIVQDQARRGGRIRDAAASLQRVPGPRPSVVSPIAWRVFKWCAAILAIELILIWAII